MKTCSYQTNDTDPNKYDIFEVGGEVIAKSVPWEFVENLVRFLNTPSKSPTSEFGNLLPVRNKTRMVRALKNHTCCVCGGLIAQGEEYKNYNFIPENKLYKTLKAHDACGSLIKGFNWDSRKVSIVL